MDGSVKNLLAAEREAQKIIESAQDELKQIVAKAETSAQTRINEVRQRYDSELQAQEDDVSNRLAFSNSLIYHIACKQSIISSRLGERRTG